MRNIFKTILTTGIALACAGQVFAAGNLSAKIEVPKSPSNQTEVKINVVVLDVEAVSPITVKCFKVGSPDAQFGSDIAVAAGGTSVNCQTNGSIITGEGTYQFYATATNGSETVTTDTVTIQYNLNGPQAPTNYSKESVNSCTWKIKFRTADDGKTAKVELYRSENTTFSADNGNKIASQNIGPNTEGEFVTGKPDCNKTYYYAIRSFDSIGNGSSAVGDSETHVTTTTVSTTSGTSGANGTSGALASGTNGNVLGAGNSASEVSTGASGTILGEASKSATPTATYTPQQTKTSAWKYLGLAGAVIVIALGIWLVKQKKSA